VPVVVNDARARFAVLPGKVGGGSLTATIVLKATFDLAHDGPATLVPEDEQPHLDGDRPWENDPARGLREPTDFALFKPGTDLLLAGHCHAPSGRPTLYTQVSFGVEAYRKVAVVFGDRMIRRGLLAAGVSEPVPFTRMPLDWSRGYGGPGHAPNPVGRGATDVVLADGSKARLLPNVESMDRLVGPELRDVDPTGFGPIDGSWPQRMRYVGSYGAGWLKERWPWYPEDFDWTYFNSAPEDQRLPGTYLRGDEQLELVNLDAEHPTFRARLPGLRGRAFVRVRRGTDLEFREVLLRIDTLLVDMDTRRASLTWRGVTPIATVKMKEVEEYFFLLEPGRAPLGTGLPDYEALYLKRLAEIQEEFKIPPVVLSAPPVPDVTVPSLEWVDALRALADSMRKGAALSPPPAPPPIGPLGVRYPAAPPPPPPPPPPKTIAEINKQIQADWAVMDANDPGFAKKYPPPDFSEFEADIAELDAFTGLPPEDPEVEEVEWDRERVVQHARNGGHFENQDLSGLDLSGLDLSRVRFLEADLSEVDLSGAILIGTDFSRAVLTGSNLDRADFSEARLDEADLASVSAGGTRFPGCSMREAEFSGSRMPGAVLDRVDGARASFGQCDLAGASFTEARLPQADFTEALLTGANFRGAALTSAEMDGVDAGGVNFESASMVNLRASKAMFRGCRLRSALADRAIFEESDFHESDFRETKLRGATLTGSRVEKCIFALADLRHVLMDDLVARGATFVGVDLFRSTLERADLTGATFIDCNLFEVEFFEATLEGTSFREVNLKGTKIGS
jgi:uncharacterized protein YjbI with pentapeptide repeats